MFDDPSKIGGHHHCRCLRGGHACQFRILFQLYADEDQRQHHGGGRKDIGNGSNVFEHVTILPKELTP